MKISILCVIIKTVAVMTVNLKQKNLLHYSGILNNIRRCVLMAYVINDDCISCGACAGECPVGAISEGDAKYVIDEGACISCGACAGVCPVGAPQE